MKTPESSRFNQRFLGALEKAGTSEGAHKAWLKRRRAQPEMQAMVGRATALAEQAHAGQVRGHGHGDVPYIEHPRWIAARVAAHPDATPEMIAAAWLHDAIEDTPTTAEQIAEQVSPEVAEMVEWLTDEWTHAAYPKLNRKARKAKERERLAQAPRGVKIVKLVDRLSNLRDMKAAKKGFQRVYADEAEALLDEALVGTDADLEAEVREAIAQVRRWADQQE